MFVSILTVWAITYMWSIGVDKVVKANIDCLRGTSWETQWKTFQCTVSVHFYIWSWLDVNIGIHMTSTWKRSKFTPRSEFIRCWLFELQLLRICGNWWNGKTGNQVLFIYCMQRCDFWFSLCSWGIHLNVSLCRFELCESILFVC